MERKNFQKEFYEGRVGGTECLEKIACLIAYDVNRIELFGETIFLVSLKSKKYCVDYCRSYLNGLFHNMELRTRAEIFSDDKSEKGRVYDIDELFEEMFGGNNE